MRNFSNFIGTWVIVVVALAALVGCGKDENLRAAPSQRPVQNQRPVTPTYGYTSPLRTCITNRGTFASHAAYCSALIWEEYHYRCGRNITHNVYWISCQ